MPSASNGKIELEFAATAVAMAALTDSGDQTIFAGNGSDWSRLSGLEPVVRPNGVVSGLVVSTHASNDTVTISAGTAYIAGVLVSIPAGSVAITREMTDAFLTTSICVIADGTFSSDEGGAHTSALSSTRAADGGPPLLATTKIELAQVKTTSVSAAVIAASEIFQVPNVHREVALFPGYNIGYDGGIVTLTAPLMQNHTGPVPKAVYASYANPIFSEQAKCNSYVPAETSYTQQSTPIYGGNVGSESSSLAQGSFTVFLENGITDPMIQNIKNQFVWTKFYPNRSSDEHIKGQARLGLVRAFPADNAISAACTLTAETAFTDEAA